MQLLVPPLDDSCRGDFSKTSLGSSNAENSRPRSVMSQGLQDKFEALQDAAHPPGASARSRRGGDNREDSAEEQGEEEVMGEDQQQQKKKRRIAMETALAIESEVQKWERGIAELEAMLDQANGGLANSTRTSSSSLPEARVRHPEMVRFPSLPPIVPAEEGDIENRPAAVAAATVVNEYEQEESERKEEEEGKPRSMRGEGYDHEQ